MKLAGVPFYQANANNYARGRVRPIRKLTIHHSAGWEATLRYLWADPNRNASSTFWVGNLLNQIEQYVDTDDTPYTNGNYDSNSESLTVETRGDWRGYYDRGTLDNLFKLMTMLLPHYPNLILEFHMDVSRSVTLCPADLKHKGYARAEWDRAVAQFNQPAPTPTPPVSHITYEAIAPKRVKLTRAANLWNFNFTNWANAQAVKPYNAGDVIDVVAVATNQVGGKYYMTAYSYNNGAVRATNGFNVVDCEDYAPVITQPPTVEEKWEPMQNPRKMRLVYAVKG
ncbi:MAG: N-acetylmuramoyl-L-alanine amidase, partial [Candidatus Paceibacterota bacterium]